MAGVDLNVTMWYNFLVDKNTGMVLDVHVDIMLENATVLPAPGYLMVTFMASDESKLSSAMGNAVMGWSISQMPAPVLDVSMSLYDMEVTYNIAKAAVTQGLLDVADGDEPALDIHLTMNATTKAAMIAKVEATLASLMQLEGLKALHGLNMILVNAENEVAHVYYKQLDEDPEGAENKGSVKYHGEESKKIDDKLNLYGTTIPIVLFVIAVVLILVGIALMVAGPKEEPVEEDDEEPSEEGEEGEGEE